MNEKQIKKIARAEVQVLKTILKVAAKGKTTKKGSLEINDVAELIQYYKTISSGQFKIAADYQWDMDTDIRERCIDIKVFDFIEEFYNGE